MRVKVLLHDPAAVAIRRQIFSDDFPAVRTSLAAPQNPTAAFDHRRSRQMTEGAEFQRAHSARAVDCDDFRNPMSQCPGATFQWTHHCAWCGGEWWRWLGHVRVIVPGPVAGPVIYDLCPACQAQMRKAAA